MFFFASGIIGAAATLGGAEWVTNNPSKFILVSPRPSYNLVHYLLGILLPGPHPNPLTWS